MLTNLIHCPGADIRQSPSERAHASTGMRFLTVVVHKLLEAVEACRTGGAGRARTELLRGRCVLRLRGGP